MVSGAFLPVLVGVRSMGVYQMGVVELNSSRMRGERCSFGVECAAGVRL
jgi:hypothetical protein